MKVVILGKTQLNADVVKKETYATFKKKYAGRYPESEIKEAFKACGGKVKK